MLLCRARAESAATARVLADRGYDPVVAPVLDIVPLPVALPDGLPDAVAATSARAVEALGPERATPLLPCPAFAVGRRTAEAFSDAGFRHVRVAGENSSELATSIAAWLPPGARLLYLAGLIRNRGLEEALARGGVAVVVRETYEAREAEPWDETAKAALAADGIAACLHYSARSAALAQTFATRAGCGRDFAAALHVCLSEAVADVLRTHGLDRFSVAEHPTEASLVQALASSLPTGR